MSKRAWVTLATNDSYGLGALVLAHSLRRTGSLYPAVVLITPSVTQSMRDRLSVVFTEVITVDVLDSKDAAHLALLQRPELGITFTKIHCWNLTQYEKCVFLDADTLVVQNSDELFERAELSAAPDVGWPDCFNSGVFVFQPSPDTFEELIKFAQERGSFDGGDQGLLNSFFSDWAHGDINKHLPFVYNVTSAAFYSYLPALKHYGQNLKIIHFIGAAKPWLQQYNWESGSVEAPEHLREFLQLWWDLFVANVHAQLDVSMVEIEETSCELPELPPQDVFRYYEPMIDPDSEFPWHHPDAQSHDEESNTSRLDMTEFHDPWELYRENIPPNADNPDYSLYLEIQKESNTDARKRFWEHCFLQEDNRQIQKQESTAQTIFEPGQPQRPDEFSYHDKHQHEKQVYHYHIHEQHNHSYQSNKLYNQPHNQTKQQVHHSHINDPHKHNFQSYELQHNQGKKAVYHSHIHEPHNYSYQLNENRNDQQNQSYQPVKQQYPIWEQNSHLYFEQHNHDYHLHESYNPQDKNNIRDQQREHYLHIHDQQHKYHDYWNEGQHNPEHNQTSQHEHHAKQIYHCNASSLDLHNSHHSPNHCILKHIDEFQNNKDKSQYHYQTLSNPCRLDHKNKKQVYQVQMDHFGNYTSHHPKGSPVNGDLLEDDNEYQEYIIPRHPYDGFYLRHRATVDSRGYKICSHELLLQSSSPPDDCTTSMELLSGDVKDQSGVAGNLARVVPGTAGFQREALDELTRRQGWEAGNIDYMGADSFDNIWAKISQTLSQPRSSPPKQSPPRESSPPQKQPSPVEESPPQPEITEDRNAIQEPVTEPIEKGQEAIALGAPATDALATVDTVSLEKSQPNVTLEIETPAKAITSEASVIDTIPTAVDVIEKSVTVTESSTKIKDKTPGETQATADAQISEEIVTNASLPPVDTPLTGQTIALLETSGPTDKESIVLEKDSALDTRVPIPESKSQEAITDTSAPIDPSAAVALKTPALIDAALSISEEAPVSKDVPEPDTIKSVTVESNKQDQTVTTDVTTPLKEVSVSKELAPPVVTESTVSATHIAPAAAELPASALIDESASKEIPLIAETPSSVLPESPVEAVTPTKAKTPASVPYETVASQTSDKAAEMTKEEPAKKIDTSKVPQTPPTTPKSTPEATTPVAELAPKTDPLDKTQKFAVPTESSASESQKTIDTPIVTPASPISTDMSSPIATVAEATPEKPSDAQEVSTDSPPLANTPSKEEAPALPAAKSTEEAAQETRL